MSMKSVSLAAPAKINLFLKVLGRRPDGYHEIFTLFQRIDLADRLTFRLSPEGEGCRIACSSPETPTGPENLIAKATNIFKEYTSLKFGLEVELDKIIPVAAGLGGGSSDAATTLEAVNLLTGKPLKREELFPLARRLGADVPFFIGKRTAMGRGIGDLLEPLPPLPPLYIVLVTPPFPVSTAWAYGELTLALTNRPVKTTLDNFDTQGVNSLRDLCKYMENDFETVVIRRHPEVGEIKALLESRGAVKALLSGSGPTVFGLFAEEERARDCRKELAGFGRGVVHFARGVDEYWGVDKW